MNLPLGEISAWVGDEPAGAATVEFGIGVRAPVEPIRKPV